MAEVRHLSRAPITEALIDIRVTLTPEYDCNRFLELKDNIEPTFPHLRTNFAIAGKLEVNNNVPVEASTEANLRGYLFVSEDEKNILQYRLDGFTRNQLKPYTSWDAFFEDSLRWWELYCANASPRAIKRIAVRYINRFDVPVSTANFGDYLAIPPQLPDDIPNIVTEFSSRVVLMDAESRSSVTLIQGIEPSIAADKATIVVDIDAWKHIDVSFDSVRNDLEQLHQLKNKIFFNTLTEQALEMFE